jgi:O-antigen ligase
MADSNLEKSGIEEGPTTVEHTVAVLTGFSLLAVFILPSQSAASFSTYALAVIVLLAGSSRWQMFIESRVLAGLLLALLAYFSASVWWSAELSLRGAFSIYTRCVLILTFVVALSVALRRIPHFAQWLARAMTLSAGIAALGALIDFHLHPTFDDRLRGLGQLGNSVVASFAFVAALLVAADVVIEDSVRWRIGAIVCVVLIASTIFAAGSRAGYLAALVGLVVLFGARRLHGRPASLRWFAAASSGAIVVGLLVLMARPDLQGVIFPRGDSFRLAIWSVEWKRLIAQNVLFGLGILTNDGVVIEDRTFSHPHSLYLASALQGGLVGLLLLVLLLGCAARRLLHNLHQSVARLGVALLAAGMSAYAFDGWELIDKVGLSWLLLWVPVAVAMAVGVKSSEGIARNMVESASTGNSPRADGRQP